MIHPVLIDDLIEVLEGNLSEHKAIFDKAVANYRVAATQRLQAEMDQINKRFLHEVRIALPVPEDHSGDYERILRMLRMAKAAGNTIMNLTDEEARMYVQDDWEWRRAWVQNTVSYTD